MSSSVMNGKVWSTAAFAGGLLVGAVVMAPTLVDANGYKADLEAAVSRATGRPVHVDGSMSWRVLPWPVATVRGLRVGNVAGGSVADMVQVPEIRLGLSVWGLLRGQVEITSLQLVNPWVLLENGSEGPNWQLQTGQTFPAGPAGSAGPAGASVSGQIPPPAGGVMPEGGLQALLPVAAGAMSSGQRQGLADGAVEILGGTVLWRPPGAGGAGTDSGADPRQPRSGDSSLSGINATLTSPGRGVSSGLWKLEGDARYNRAVVRFLATLGASGGAGAPGGEREVPAGLRLAVEGTDAVLLLSGSLGRDEAGLLWHGDLKADGSQLAAVANRLSPRGEKPLQGGLSLRGALTVSSRHSLLENLTLDLGDTHIQGRLAVDHRQLPATLEARLSVGSLDLDRWLAGEGGLLAGDTPAAGAGGQPTGKQSTGKQSTGNQSTGNQAAGGKAESEDDFASRLETSPRPVRPAVWALTLPENMRGTADLRASAVTWRGGVIRQAHLALTVEENRLRLDELTALLPGNSTVAAAGTLAPALREEGGVSLDLSVQAQSDNLRAVVDWLGASAWKTPGGRLGRFQAAATVGGTLRELTVREIEGTVDTTSWRGAAVIRPPLVPGQRLQVGANVAVDSLNLDAYRVPAAVAAAPAAAPAVAGNSPSPSPAASPAAGPGLPWWSGIDSNLIANVDTLTWNTVPLRGVHLDASLLDDTLTLRNSGIRNVASGELVLDGRIESLSLAPRLRDFRYSLSSADPQRLSRALSLDLPLAAPAALGEVTLAGTANGLLTGSEAALTLDSRNRFAGGGVDLAATVKPAAAPGAPSGNALPLWDSPLALQGTLTARLPDAARLGRLWSAGYQSARPPGPLSMEASWSLANGEARLSGLDLTVGGDHLGGEAALSWTGPRPRVTATLQADALHLDHYWPVDRHASGGAPAWREGRAGGSGAPAGVQVAFAGGAAGLSPAIAGDVPAAFPDWHTIASAAHWSSRPLDSDGLRSVDASLSLKARQLSAPGLVLDNAAASLELANGLLTVDKASGSLYGGPFTGSLRLDARAGGPSQGTAGGPSQGTAGGPSQGTAGGPVQGAVSVKAENFQLARALEALTGTASATGNGHLSLELTASGGSEAALVDSLAGQGSFSLDQVRPQGGGRSGGVASVLVAPLVALNQLATLTHGGDATARVTGGFTAQNGILSLQNTSIDSPLYQGRLQGIVNLGMWTLDVEGQARLSQTLMASFLGQKFRIPEVVPIAMSGDIDAPRVRINTGGILPPGGNGSGSSEPPPARPLEQILPGILQKYLHR